jgi:hypothetical protein
MTDIVKTGLQNAKGPATGSAPLNSQQLGVQNDSELDLMRRRFSSPEEMIMTLRKQHTAQSEAILRKLWEKAIEASKIHHTPMQYPKEDEITKEGNAKRDFLNPDSIHEEGSELEKLGILKNPLFYSQKNREEFEKLKKETRKERTQ